MKTALLVIDVQNALVLSKKPELYARDTVIANMVEVIRKARLGSIPIFYIRHESKEGGWLAYGSEGWKIYDVVAPGRSDKIVGKSTPDAFRNTTLRTELEETDVDKLIMIGLQTDFCVNATARRAVSLGYDTTVVSDAHSTFDRGILKASTIISHHNEAWAKHGIRLVKTAELTF